MRLVNADEKSWTLEKRVNVEAVPEWETRPINAG
jgi:hypothetical protein